MSFGGPPRPFYPSGPRFHQHPGFGPPMFFPRSGPPRFPEPPRYQGPPRGQRPPNFAGPPRGQRPPNFAGPPMGQLPPNFARPPTTPVTGMFRFPPRRNQLPALPPRPAIPENVATGAPKRKFGNFQDNLPKSGKKQRLETSCPVTLYNRIWAKSYDRALPHELLSQCQPLSCNLCSAILNSPIQSQMHYEGKIHDKKARNFLQVWSVQNQQIMPMKKDTNTVESQPILVTSKELAKLAVAIVPVSEANEAPMTSNLYCQPCDISFTSVPHATQHYQGKNHAKKLKSLAASDQTPNCGSQNSSVIVASVPPPPPPSLCGVNPFFCYVCGVKASSQQQIDTHLNGKSHKQKIEKTKISAPKVNTAVGAVKKENYSIYRTPSGQFYCSICNNCVDSESQFGLHLDSRKHKQKNASKKPQRNYNL